MRRGWSQLELMRRMIDRGVPMHNTTIPKIEAGDRGVTPAELYVFADVFGMSVDTLLGRATNGVDLTWAISKLTGTAQRMARDVRTLQGRLDDEVQDVQLYADAAPQRTARLLSQVSEVQKQLADAASAVAELGAEFPLPGARAG
jgi:transcriptional regulator with XRE-family HTH domain